jgi:hypothetical protein
MKIPRLHPADLEALAQRTAQLMRPVLLDTDPEMTKAEAALYCRCSEREFDRERERFLKNLKPARNSKPLLWRRSTLDCYRAIRAGGERKAS